MEYETGYKKGYNTGWWQGCGVGFFTALAICLLLGAFIP